VFFIQTACQGHPAEIFFLLDSSSSIWSVDFKKMISFVNDVIASFDIGPDMTRVGVASFSYRYRPNFDLGTYTTVEDVQRAVSDIRQIYGGTYTYDALDGVRMRGLSPTATRPDVNKFVFVLTDGESYNAAKTKDAAMKLKVHFKRICFLLHTKHYQIYWQIYKSRKNIRIYV